VVDNSVDAREAQQLQQTIDTLQAQAGSPLAVQLILNTSNTGFGEANNLAFSKCQGDGVMLLNPDAHMRPHCLLNLAMALHTQPQLGACCPKQYWDEAQLWQLPPAWLPTGIGEWTLTQAHHHKRAAQRVSNAYRKLALNAWQSKLICSQRAISGGAMMVRRSAINGPLFDPAFFMYFEDSDLSLRLKQSGWQLAMVSDAHLVHEWTHSAGKVAMMESSKAHFFAKHFNGRGQWQQRMDSLVQTASGAIENPLHALDLTLSDESLTLNVPEAWASGWLLEASPSPLFTPAAGQLGVGSQASVSKELLHRMSFAAEGSKKLNAVYVRLGPAAKTLGALQIFKIDLN
jgi:GT2 family glycosyltransferase